MSQTSAIDCHSQNTRYVVLELVYPGHRFDEKPFEDASLFLKNYLESARAGRIREDADDKHSKDEDEGEKNLGKFPKKENS